MRIARLIRIITCALLPFFLTPISAMTILPGTRPADPSLFKNGVLQLVVGNCQVPTPQGKGWHWLEMTSAKTPAYICINDETHQNFTVVVQAQPATHVSESYLNGVFSGIEESARESHKQFKRINGPFPTLTNKEAVGFAFSMREESGQEFYSYGYIVPTGSICMIQVITTEAHAPKYFLDVAGSVQPLSELPIETAFPIVHATASWLPYIFLGTITWAIISGFNRSRKNRSRWNPWSAVYVVVLLLASVNIFLLVRSKVFENMAEGQPPQALGFVSAAPMMILIGLIWPWIRFFRANRASNPDA